MGQLIEYVSTIPPREELPPQLFVVLPEPDVQPAL
jgi:hypothetical protein